MTMKTTRRGFLQASLGGAVCAGLARPLAALASSADWTRRLGVCSWSLEPASAEDLLDKLARTGLTRLQIALDPLRENSGGKWAGFADLSARRGVTSVSGMMGMIGEDYSTLESIRRTGGVVPDATWPGNWRNIQANADLAGTLGLKLVTFHAGFLPEEEGGPAFAELQSRIRQIADLFASRGMALGLETGQETADTMAGFLRALDRPNVGVNFDPANLILYAKDEPVAALRKLVSWVRQCHVKDAVRTKVPGTWGEEVPVGTGEVDWRGLLRVLEEAGFTGPLCIEREAGSDRVGDIRKAREYIEQSGASKGRAALNRQRSVS
jgi:L-ribulose-5-phosphate 3-epimerase